MALGKTAISAVEEKTANIKNIMTELDDCHNTYSYVSNYLGNWADETAIGKEMQTNMIELSKALKELIDGTKRLSEKISSFTTTQQNINS